MIRVVYDKVVLWIYAKPFQGACAGAGAGVLSLLKELTIVFQFGTALLGFIMMGAAFVAWRKKRKK